MRVACQFIVLSAFIFIVMGTAPQNLRDLLGIGKAVISGDIRDLLGVDAGRYPGRPQRPCPLCDSSVYSYCSDKLFHDSCCCSSAYDRLPYQCQLADCSFLHSNSCYEHRLITQCCCTNHILYKK